MIRPAGVADVKSVVGIHADAFPKAFLTSLGPVFLDCYYRGQLAYEKSIFIVDEDGGPARGFVCGSAAPDEFYRFLIKTRIHTFFIASFFAFLNKPSIALKLLSALRYPSKVAHRKGYHYLISLGVDPIFQSAGIGSRLVQEYIRLARKSSVQGVVLVTDGKNNESTQRFYAKNGFKAAQTIVKDNGRTMIEYVMEF